MTYSLHNTSHYISENGGQKQWIGNVYGIAVGPDQATPFTLSMKPGAPTPVFRG